MSGWLLLAAVGSDAAERAAALYDAAHKSYNDDNLTDLILIGTGDNDERDVFEMGSYVMGAARLEEEVPVRAIVINKDDTNDDSM